MLQLYFFPMACSLACRIALMEAGIEADYRQVDIFTKKVSGSAGDYRSIAPKGAVPMLVLEDGQTLTENAAVLQYIADLRPESGLAPPPGKLDRYRVQEWLSFVGTELHKAFLFPMFWYANDAAKASARERIDGNVAVVAAHLDGRSFLVGERFTVADAHLTWALLLLRFSGIDLSAPSLVAYLERVQQRPAVRNAIGIEMELRRKAVA